MRRVQISTFRSCVPFAAQVHRFDTIVAATHTTLIHVGVFVLTAKGIIELPPCSSYSAFVTHIGLNPCHIAACHERTGKQKRNQEQDQEERLVLDEYRKTADN